MEYLTVCEEFLTKTVQNLINQSKHIYIALCAASESERRRPTLITSAEEGGYVFTSACLSVRLSVYLSVG